MSKYTKLLIFALIILISGSFITIGYAAYSSTLSVEGTFTAEPKAFEGIYIESVTVLSGNGVSSNSFNIIHPTTLETDARVTQVNVKITYEVILHNDSDVTYWYLGTSAAENYGANNLLNQSGGIFIYTYDTNDTNSTPFNNEDWIPPRTRRTIYVTYLYSNNAVTQSTKNLINFKFGLYMDSVQDGFLKVLNDKTSEYGYNYLAGEFNDKYSETGSTVIGNIGDDKEMFDNLFGPNIHIDVNGESVPVTIMVERKNVDGKSTGDSYSGNGAPSGCEYTLYITTDSLDGGPATVYAVTYTCDANGVWRQIGELYEGTSQTEQYDDENMGLDVDSWVAVPKEYTITGDISYKIGYVQGSQEANQVGANGADFWRTIPELMGQSEVNGQLDNNFYNKVTNSSQTLLKDVCNILYRYQHNGQTGQWDEFDNENNMAKPGYDRLKAAFLKMKPYLYIGNGAQEVKIQNASTLPRAEIVPLLEEILKEYEYYKSVNGE